MIIPNLGLFQIILEILCDALMQVNALVTHHIVTLARISEEVRLSAGLAAGIEEHEAVLWLSLIPI